MITNRSAAELLTDAARAVRNDADIPREELAQLLDGMGAYWSDHVCDSDCDRGGRKCEDLPLGRLAKAILGEVEPPLPPEPGTGKHAQVEFAIFRHWDDGWYQITEQGPWPDSKKTSWPAICDYSTETSGMWPTVLVPDPVQDAPELPWVFMLGDKSEIEIARVDVSGDDPSKVHVWVEYEAQNIPPAVARSFAAALWRAADQVESGSGATS